MVNEDKAREADEGRLEREVGRPVPECANGAPLCCYCKQPAPGYTPTEAANGKRWLFGTLEYHCYDGYCSD